MMVWGVGAPLSTTVSMPNKTLNAGDKFRPAQDEVVVSLAWQHVETTTAWVVRLVNLNFHIYCLKFEF